MSEEVSDAGSFLRGPPLTIFMPVPARGLLLFPALLVLRFTLEEKHTMI